MKWIVLPSKERGVGFVIELNNENKDTWTKIRGHALDKSLVVLSAEIPVSGVFMRNDTVGYSDDPPTGEVLENGILYLRRSNSFIAGPNYETLFFDAVKLSHAILKD